MTIKAVRLGRPPVLNPKPPAQRTRESKARAKAQGCVDYNLIVEPDIDALFNQLRSDAGFSPREKSQFFAALILRVSNKPWLGPSFTLPIEVGA
ncbi:hypothetical protein [Enterovibrio nigricans]|uniref:Uncharacterized protein n=1 Tax=Enterovibrio nigricans DSM 22720 TaxID=1121868 RepID=A0A1T4UV68_9GAMM|nr:hypothetical protein [Enterovibrio nigricans]PKF50908.1 hypothetical protein AT251_07760 [Enterovibrio nigricans]SKA56570.1 hypothetical protein SAMN02745132_02587 [Enterovibrio nigricans DSM 22720]